MLSAPAFLGGCGALPSMDLGSPEPSNPCLDWFGIDTAQLARVLSALTANGADRASVFFQHRETRQLSMQQGELSEPRADIVRGAGMRVAWAGSEGFAHTANPDGDGLLLAAIEAASGLQGSASSIGRGFEVVPPPALYVAGTSFAELGMAPRAALLGTLEATVRRRDAAIEDVIVRWRDVDERVLVASADGRAVTDQRPLAVVSVQVIAVRAGVRVSGFANLAARAGIDWFTDARLEALGTSAVERTLSQFDARQPPAGRMPVVFAPGLGGIVLHEAIGHAFEADLAPAGFAGFVAEPGARVAGDGVTLIDAPATPAARGALAVDDEGHAGSATTLVRNGQVTGWLHDAASAARAGTTPTGNGRCQSYRQRPLPRMTCTYLDNGPHDPADIEASVERGIYAETIVDGGVAPDSGTFRFTVKNGWLLENGRKTMPLRDIVIEGTAATLLPRIAMVGNDRTLVAGGWTCGKLGQRVPVSPGAPTVRIDELDVRSSSGA